MRSVALLTLAAVLCGEPEAPDLSGLYDVAGVDVSSGEPYAGIAIFTKRADGYLVQYTAGVGSNAVGVGSLDGDRFSVAWTQGGRLGLSTYVVKGKKLTGKWLVLPEATEQAEELTFSRKFPEPKPRQETSCKGGCKCAG